MKILFTVLASFVLLVGCGQSQQPAVEAPAAPVEASAPANDVIVDYVWNDVGPDVTEEQFADIVARWNARIDAGGYDMMGANVLTPQFETEDYDVIWVLLWPSSEAREAAWTHWNANQVEAWTAELDGALSYQAENVFTFKPVGGWDKNLEPVPAGGSFMPNFSFCKMNEGADEATFETFRAEYDAWLEEDDAADYGYYIMEPQFEQDDADFVWLDIFSDEAAMAAGSDSWTGSELEAKWNAMGTCENFAFAATAIRR
jgi:hypothetical protein